MSFTMSQEFIRQAIANQLQNEKCCDLHPGSCSSKAFKQLIGATKAMAWVYFVVHFLPLIIRHKKVLKNPFKELKKSAYGYAKSMLFVASSLFLIRRLLCLWTQMYKFKNVTAVYTGFFTAIPLLLESPGRQIQISLFTLNKSTQMLYFILKRRYPFLRVQNGQTLLLIFSIAILSYHYFEDKNLFRPLYQTALNVILKDI